MKKGDEMITVADVLIKFTERLFDIKNRIEDLERDRKHRVADYFENISKTTAVRLTFAKSAQEGDNIDK